MQKLISIFGFSLLCVITCQASNGLPQGVPNVSLEVDTPVEVYSAPLDCGCITPALANQILKACADIWAIPKGELQAEMVHGDLTITPVIYYTGDQAYDVVSTKYGTVCVLEIDL